MNRRLPNQRRLVTAIMVTALSSLLIGLIVAEPFDEAIAEDSPAPRDTKGSGRPSRERDKSADKSGKKTDKSDSKSQTEKAETPDATKPDATKPGKTEKPDKPAKPGYETLNLRGRVVWLDEALKRKYGIQVDLDAQKQSVVLEDAEGRLHPIVKDFRGRGFHKDPRLMAMDVELRVRRYPGSPMIQVVGVSRYKEGVKYDVDYWCDICAIPMYELKDCECCQGPIRLRERQVEEKE